MAKMIDTLLLLALPASGKSEVRRYMAHLTPQQCRNEMHMGETVQLDDFPYVHMMRRIDEELQKQGQPYIYFHAPDRSFQDPLEWGTLIELLNEDYADLRTRKIAQPASAAKWLMERFDHAYQRVGGTPRLAKLPAKISDAVAKALEPEAADLLQKKHEGYPDTLEGKTIVIEFARGGADGLTPPLKAPFGYQYSLAQLSPEILQRSTILYIWVTPEESRRKNQARTNPDDPGSILHHGVPLEVMLKDYGCDDMQYLIEQSDRPHTVKFQAHGKTQYLPIATFDNRVDKTTFVREAPAKWAKQDVDALHNGLADGLRRAAEATR